VKFFLNYIRTYFSSIQFSSIFAPLLLHQSTCPCVRFLCSGRNRHSKPHAARASVLITRKHANVHKKDFHFRCLRDMNEDKLSEAERLTLELTSNPDRENLVTLIVDGDLRIIHEQDLRRVQSSFEKMDRDRSMSLSREDFRALARINNANVERALAFFDNILGKMDFNHDGEVSYKEFLRYFVITALFDAQMSRVPVIPTSAVSGDIILMLFIEFRSAFKSKVWDFENLMNAQ